MTDDEIIKVVAARRDGATIQCRPVGTNHEWQTVYLTAWNFAYFEYRVLPEERTSNREKLFYMLIKMPNEELARNVNLSCSECPAREYCLHTTTKGCHDTMFAWLSEGGPDHV